MAASLRDPGLIPGWGPKRFHDSLNCVFYIVFLNNVQKLHYWLLSFFILENLCHKDFDFILDFDNDLSFVIAFYL